MIKLLIKYSIWLGNKMLKLKNNWIWDFWFAEDGEKHTCFYLQAPKSLR